MGRLPRQSQVDDSLYAMALDPMGTRIYLGGYGGTVAYNAATGAKLWENSDFTRTMTVSADSSHLFATVQPDNFPNFNNLAAYEGDTGKTVWSIPLPDNFGPPRHLLPIPPAHEFILRQSRT